MPTSRTQPIVNEEVPPSLVFGEHASNVKSFPKTRPQTGENGYANFDDGIPEDYSTTADPAKQLKARIEDVNAIGRLASSFHFYRQCGGIVTFSEAVSSAIGGYPKGAVLEYWGGEYHRKVISLIENNVYNFVKRYEYIDGIHWAYADEWGKPYGIFVDTSRVETLPFISGGSANSALGWTVDDSEYNWVDEDAGYFQYRGKLDLMKSKWILLTADCFVIVSLQQTTQTSNTYPALYWMVAGYRIKDSGGTVKTFPMTASAYQFFGDDADAEVPGTVFPIAGNGFLVAREGGENGIYRVLFTPGSTCMYMKRGSMLQLVYAPPLLQSVVASVQFVRLKGR